MRRVMLLALLALGSSTAALATSVDYSTGGFVSGTFSGSFTTTVNLSITGVEHTIAVSTGALTPVTGTTCPVGATCFSFTTGTVTVDDPSGTQIFMNSLKGGILVNDHGAIAVLATLVATPPNVTLGSATVDAVLSVTKVDAGSGDVSFTNATIPEPSTLGLLGTGLIGLAAMVGHKLRPKM